MTFPTWRLLPLLCALALPAPAGETPFANAEFRAAGVEEGDRFVTATSSFSGNVNYIVNNEANVSEIWSLCTDSLGVRHRVEVMRFVPQLAESWEKSADGLTYTIRLRAGALWHPFRNPVGGAEVPARPVTADDFVFFWQTINNPAIPCDPIRSYFKLMDRIEAVDERTLRVVWKEPYSLADEQTFGLTPLPRHYYRPDPSWTDAKFAEEMITSPRNQFVVGCGPWRFVEWKKGQEVRFELFDGYYGPKPALRACSIQEIKDPEVALLEFEKGRLDQIGLMPHHWSERTKEPLYRTVTPSPATFREDSLAWDEAKRAGRAPAGYKFEKFLYPSFVYSFIGWNARVPLFRDPKVRLALTHLVHRERILEEVYFNLATIISGPFVPQSPYSDPAIQPWPYDPEKAKGLLREAGWEDTDGDGWLDKDLDGDGKRERFAFTFLVIANHPLQEKFVPILQEDFAAAGVKFDIKPAEWSVYTEALDEWKYDACSLGWAGGIESDPYQIWHSSQAKLKKGSNHVGYESAEADRLIEEGRRTTDPEKRAVLYRKFHRLLHEEQPYTFLFCPTSRVAQDRRYRNVRVFTGGMDQNLYFVPKAEQRATP